MSKLFSAVFAATLAISPAAFADSDHGKKGHSGHGASSQSASSQGASAQTADMAEGEIRRVDKDAKKITIKHGPLQSLDMPAMTMVFQVRDLAQLEQVQVGDKVKFSAEKLGGAYTVTSIEKAK